jgi:hypothetical protein
MKALSNGPLFQLAIACLGHLPLFGSSQLTWFQDAKMQRNAVSHYTSRNQAGKRQDSAAYLRMAQGDANTDQEYQNDCQALEDEQPDPSIKLQPDVSDGIALINLAAAILNQFPGQKKVGDAQEGKKQELSGMQIWINHWGSPLVGSRLCYSCFGLSNVPHQPFCKFNADVLSFTKHPVQGADQ